ncbi:protein SCO1/2 [Deinococcus metalli]|uniref:Electron transporter n=1 Tax=Deinococcus metalli TaxID=1141878 RepID=A0A7W8KF05_9DEIO|nr:SCO family protein [Deinococcus metalli]MBB5376977.1 protein SCO1/2 [Deinococcus metalli]GHF46763.1 electron transporter [Deinococcus metalli]
MKILTAALLAVAAILASLLLYRQANPGVSGGDALDTPTPLPAVALLDDRGQSTTLAHSDGRMRLVFYGYVRCPDVCPATLASLKNTWGRLDAAQRGKVQVQFISVDPAHDRPDVVRAYLDKFDGTFTGLTGTSEAVNAAAKAMFVGLVTPLAEHGAHDGGAHDAATVSAAPAELLHGDQVSVVDTGGRFVRVYGNGAVIDGTLERDLPGLIKQYGS